MKTLLEEYTDLITQMEAVIKVAPERSKPNFEKHLAEFKQTKEVLEMEQEMILPDMNATLLQ